MFGVPMFARSVKPLGRCRPRFQFPDVDGRFGDCNEADGSVHVLVSWLPARIESLLRVGGSLMAARILTLVLVALVVSSAAADGSWSTWSAMTSRWWIVRRALAC
jgi:hypothetical protein